MADDRQDLIDALERRRQETAAGRVGPPPLLDVPSPEPPQNRPRTAPGRLATAGPSSVAEEFGAVEGPAGPGQTQFQPPPLLGALAPAADAAERIGQGGFENEQPIGAQAAGESQPISRDQGQQIIQILQGIRRRQDERPAGLNDVVNALGSLTEAVREGGGLGP